MLARSCLCGCLHSSPKLLGTYTGFTLPDPPVVWVTLTDDEEEEVAGIAQLNVTVMFETDTVHICIYCTSR